MKVNLLPLVKLKSVFKTQLQTDVSLRVDPTDSPDAWTVSGRGELHLSILIENMRREGFELQVSKPEVIVREIDGVRCEPLERVQIDVPEEHTGGIMESIGARKGEMLDMINNGSGQVRLIFNVPARGLIGYSTEFLTLTRGYGIMNHTFEAINQCKRVKLVDVVKVFLFQWKQERVHNTELWVWKTVVSSLLSQVQKYTKV